MLTLCREEISRIHEFVFIPSVAHATPPLDSTKGRLENFLQYRVFYNCFSLPLNDLRGGGLKSRRG